MAALFTTPKTPRQQPAQPAPKQPDEAISNVANLERMRRRRSMSRESTMITGNLGQAPVRRKQLLGA